MEHFNKDFVTDVYAKLKHSLSNPSIEWKPISKEKIYSTRIFDVEQIKSISPEGEEKQFVSLKSPEWAIVVPQLTKNGKNYFVMVEQWRHGTSSVLKEFPGGVVDEGEAPIEAAKRELLEETGYRLKNILPLGILSPNPAIMQNYCHIFFAECEEKQDMQHTDSDEFINVSLVDSKEIIKNMGCPPYHHALMCSALFLYLRHIKAII